MPRYLRYVAAASTAITVYFVLAIALGVTIVGSGNTPKPLNGAVGLLVSVVAQVAPVVSALAVNDWLRTRYPEIPRKTAPREAVGTQSPSESR
jgi:hypothetical protein